jgi:hypothetical protein
MRRTYFRIGPLPVTLVWRHFRSKGRILRNIRLDMCRPYFRRGHVTDVTSGHDPSHDPPQMWPELSHILLSWITTWFVTKVTLRMSLVEQRLPTLPGHLSLPWRFCEVRVAQSLFYCVMFCRSLSVYCFSSSDYYTVCYFLVCITTVSVQIRLGTVK